MEKCIYSFGEGDDDQLGDEINKDKDYEPKQVINARNIKLFHVAINTVKLLVSLILFFVGVQMKMDN